MCGGETHRRDKLISTSEVKKSYYTSENLEKLKATLLAAYEEDVDVVSMADFQNWKCPYCGIEMDTQSTKDYNHRYRTLDHMIPLSKGGRHASYNIIACCCGCNIKKKDRDLEDWINHITGNPNYNPYHGIIEEKLNLLKENTCFGQT